VELADMKISNSTGKNKDFYDLGKKKFDQIRVLPEHQVKAATPHAELIAQLMNPNFPKNEREHAAVQEIESLHKILITRAEQIVGLQDEIRNLTGEE
jgi:hypothetical protein